MQCDFHYTHMCTHKGKKKMAEILHKIINTSYHFVIGGNLNSLIDTFLTFLQ